MRGRYIITVPWTAFTIMLLERWIVLKLKHHWRRRSPWREFEWSTTRNDPHLEWMEKSKHIVLIKLYQTFHFERQSMSMHSYHTRLQNASYAVFAVTYQVNSSQPQSPTSSVVPLWSRRPWRDVGHGPPPSHRVRPFALSWQHLRCCTDEISYAESPMLMDGRWSSPRASYGRWGTTNVE